MGVWMQPVATMGDPRKTRGFSLTRSFVVHDGAVGWAMAEARRLSTIFVSQAHGSLVGGLEHFCFPYIGNNHPN